MPLRHEPDVSQAAWFIDSGDAWRRLCSIGPSGFARYVRLFHPPRPGDDLTDPEHLQDLEGHLDDDVLQTLIGVLARHTNSPEDCFFGLWDGFGDIHGSPSVGMLQAEPLHRRLFRRRRPASSPTIPPAFAPEVIAGPRVRIPARDYLLFRGPLDMAGDWGAADLMPGKPRRLNSPNLIWPADHAWFVATEIDLPWTGVGGSAALIEDLVSAQGLEVEEVEPRDDLPYSRFE